MATWLHTLWLDTGQNWKPLSKIKYIGVCILALTLDSKPSHEHQRLCRTKSTWATPILLHKHFFQRAVVTASAAPIPCTVAAFKETLMLCSLVHDNAIDPFQLSITLCFHPSWRLSGIWAAVTLLPVTCREGNFWHCLHEPNQQQDMKIPPLITSEMLCTQLDLYSALQNLWKILAGSVRGQITEAIKEWGREHFCFQRSGDEEQSKTAPRTWRA